MVDRILLVDGLNFIYKSNISFKSATKEKQSFTIVYNFFRSIRATVEEFNPTKVFFCLEGNDNFRYQLYSEYKANRIVKTGSEKTEKAADFNRQRDIIIDLLPSLPITIVNSDKFEADDVIATLVENLKDEEVIIVSNDSDFIQLLQKGYKNLKIYNPFKKDFVSAPAYHYVSFKSIRGDQSDNIKGLAGPKKAEALATDIKKFAAFMDIEENRSNYSLNKDLIELRIIPGEELQFTEYKVNYSYLKEQFIRMDFKTMVEDAYWDRFCGTFEKLR